MVVVVVEGGAQAQSLALYPIISLPVCVGDVSELVCMYAYMLYIRVTTFLRFCRSLFPTPVHFCLSS